MSDQISWSICRRCVSESVWEFDLSADLYAAFSRSLRTIAAARRYMQCSHQHNKEPRLLLSACRKENTGDFHNIISASPAASCALSTAVSRSLTLPAGKAHRQQKVSGCDLLVWTATVGQDWIKSPEHLWCSHVKTAIQYWDTVFCCCGNMLPLKLRDSQIHCDPSLTCCHVPHVSSPSHSLCSRWQISHSGVKMWAVAPSFPQLNTDLRLGERSYKIFTGILSP